MAFQGEFYYALDECVNKNEKKNEKDTKNFGDNFLNYGTVGEACYHQTVGP